MSLFGRKDSAARFEEAVVPHERMVYLLCLRMMGRREDAEDCAQETLLRAFRAYGRFRSQANIKTWLYRIAYNTCLDALRARRGEASLDALREAGFDPAEGRLAGPEAAADRQELRRQIEEGLQLLPADQRAVMILRDFQQLPYDQIAEILEISEGTVKSRLSRAREKVKNYLLCAEQNGAQRVKENERGQK